MLCMQTPNPQHNHQLHLSNIHMHLFLSFLARFSHQNSFSVQINPNLDVTEMKSCCVVELNVHEDIFSNVSGLLLGLSLGCDTMM